MLHFISTFHVIQCAVLRLIGFFISSSTTVFLAFAIVLIPFAGLECDTTSKHSFSSVRINCKALLLIKSLLVSSNFLGSHAKLFPSCCLFAAFDWSETWGISKSLRTFNSSRVYKLSWISNPQDNPNSPDCPSPQDNLSPSDYSNPQCNPHPPDFLSLQDKLNPPVFPNLADSPMLRVIQTLRLTQKFLIVRIFCIIRLLWIIQSSAFSNCSELSKSLEE